jgi:alpha-glucosidase (family GH31 glycosyl hydrolase)
MRALLPAAVLTACLMSAQTSSFQLAEPAGRIVLTHSNYTVEIERDTFAFTVRRAGEAILESQPIRIGGSHTLAKLRRMNQALSGVELEYDCTLNGADALITVQPRADRLRITTAVVHQPGELVPRFAYKLEPSGFWYGGGFQGWRAPQILPLNQASIAPRWFLADGNSQGTPAWYGTKGVGVWVRTPHDLRYSVNGPDSQGLLAFEVPHASAVTQDIFIGANIREIVDRINREIGFPRIVPPLDYFRDPIYTTWVEHKVPVSQEKVLEFARAIRKHELPAGILELDDKWEDRYGDTGFDSDKFPDPKAMTAELRSMGFKTTIWLHPFVNTNARSFTDASTRGLLMKDASGNPGLIRWWNGPAAVWDFTNPAAANLFRMRLKKLQDLGFDGFKFDGGDVNMVPRDAQPYRPITPAEYGDVYNRETTPHFPYQETRVGVLSQPTGAVQRLIDKHSVWGKENGLAAIVPEAITVSMRGFFYVMPDMVGGNQYDEDRIDKELLVRWAQASALMPLLQFSYGPWHFDDEAVRLCREASRLHIAFTPLIYRLAQAAPKSGEPILRPLWYNDPADPNSLAITDQFMVGADVLVAPVVEKGAVSRRVYLPKGEWRDYKTKAILQGGQWVDNYPAPLDTLPLFVRAGSEFAK